MSKILLVEDDPFLSALLKNRLAKESLEILYARDGEEAIKILHDNTVDLILLDIILPKKSGFEVMEQVRTDPQIQNSAVPVVIISNLGQPEDVQKGEQLGAVGYFIKAKTSIDDLVGNVKSFLTGAPANLKSVQ